jgi:hypothetical protein
MEVLNQVIERLMNEFGGSRKATKYVVAWEPRLDVGIAVERDSVRTRSYAQVWVPHPGRNATIPSNAVEYGPTEGRHSNAYSLPGLKKGMAALRFRIETPKQLDELIRFIHAIPPIRGIA